MFFVIFQLNLPVLLAPTNYCFQDVVTPPSDRLWVVNQTFTKLDMMYTEFVVWPPDMVSVLILDSRKYDDNQIYLYTLQQPENLQLWGKISKRITGSSLVLSHIPSAPFFNYCPNAFL